MQPQFYDRFTSLNSEEAHAISRCLSQPDLDGPQLFEHCRQMSIDQAQLITAMGKSTSLVGKSAAEKILGFSVKVGWPCLSGPAPEELQSSPVAKKPRAPRKQKQKLDPRRVLEVVTPNPKKPGSASHSRFQHWYGATTVTEFLQRGGTTADVNHDTKSGFIKLGDAS